MSKAASKPLDVVVFRGFQELKLKWLKHCGGWTRLNVRASQLESPVENLTILNETIPALTKIQMEWLDGQAERILKSNFEIFGHLSPNLDTCDFSTDWRFGHCWNKDYYKNYSFYEYKDTPYDVKFPWELSRLSFLIPVLANQVVQGINTKTIIWITNFLNRWDKENPLAHSVNWYPMEASLRSINLVFLLDLTKLLLRSESFSESKAILKSLKSIIIMILFKNAAFVWRTREYTDVRGNHYTANIVALYLAGLALSGSQSETGRWSHYARQKINKEIKLQFTSDGVNFEKACGYHKLVLELFTIAGIAAEVELAPLSNESLVTLQKAAVFSDAISRPDGLAANFGDTDDACAIAFSSGPMRCHGAIIELVRSWRSMALGQVVFSEIESLAALFIVGRKPPELLPINGPEIYAFEKGGFYVARNQEKGFFFMADMGEVGMSGRGGHGHNDILSFELIIDGVPIVLDPGCSGYTADLDKKTMFRGTAAHSTIQLFSEEMADLTSHWSISNHSEPRNVVYSIESGTLNLSACHEGYSRIQEGASVSRHFTVDSRLQAVQIKDEISVLVDGKLASWHFPCGATDIVLCENSNSRAFIGKVVLRADTKLEVKSSPFSEGYGQEFVGNLLSSEVVLKAGVNSFTFNINNEFAENNA